MIIYGSYAIAHWFPDYYKEPFDIDIVVYDKALYNQSIIDELKLTNLPIEITNEDEAYFFKEFEDMTEDGYLNPTGLLTVKMSHAMYNYNLDKTVNDIIFLQKKGVTYNLDKLNMLRTHWKSRYANFREKMDFSLPANEFFNSEVQRYVEHDELHDALKLSDIPAYQKILENDTTVKVSKEKFNKLTHEEQIATFIEEISVLACERHYHKLDAKTAFITAGGEFLTRMTSGWYNIFLLDNIQQVFSFADEAHFTTMKRIMLYIKQQQSKDYNDK
jgi:hypothetical protein|tara:strand:+ start:150 stop:971 length:822 start_codon:yes stop_codon:yes gene_type:complete